MDLLNKERNDFSDEVYLQVSVMMECMNAAQMIAYRLARTLDNANIRSGLIHDRKMAYNEAHRLCKRFASYIDAAFGDKFEEVSRGEQVYHDTVNWGTCNIIRFLLLFNDRVEANDKHRELIFRHMKRLVGTGMDIEEMLKYYDIDKA